MNDAHQGFDDGILKTFSVVDIGNGKNPLATDKDQVHDLFQMFEAVISTLQKQLT